MLGVPTVPIAAVPTAGSFVIPAGGKLRPFKPETMLVLKIVADSRDGRSTTWDRLPSWNDPSGEVVANGCPERIRQAIRAAGRRLPTATAVAFVKQANISGAYQQVNKGMQPALQAETRVSNTGEW